VLPTTNPISAVPGCSGDAAQFYSRGYRLQPSPPDELSDIPSKHTEPVSTAIIAFAKFNSNLPPHSNLHKLYRVAYRKNRVAVVILSKQQAQPTRLGYPFGLGAKITTLTVGLHNT
jgi:hypothetical protein